MMCYANANQLVQEGRQDEVVVCSVGGKTIRQSWHSIYIMLLKEGDHTIIDCFQCRSFQISPEKGQADRAMK